MYFLKNIMIFYRKTNLQFIKKNSEYHPNAEVMQHSVSSWDVDLLVTLGYICSVRKPHTSARKINSAEESSNRRSVIGREVPSRENCKKPMFLVRNRFSRESLRFALLGAC